MRRFALLLAAGMLPLAVVAAGCQSIVTPTASSQGPAEPAATATALPTVTAAPSLTVVPTAIPGTLALAEPASSQVIVSPAIVRGQGTIPFERTITAQVLDAQGGLLGQGPVLFGPGGNPGELGTFWGLVAFNSPRTDQPGRLVVLTPSLRAGDVRARDEVQVTLRGTTDTPLAGLKIQSPASGDAVTSPLTIAGNGIVQSSLVLPASLVDAQGNLLGQGTVQFQEGAAPGQTAPFSGTVQFMAPSVGQLGFLLVEERATPDGQVLARDAVQVRIQPSPR